MPFYCIAACSAHVIFKAFVACEYFTLTGAISYVENQPGDVVKERFLVIYVDFRGTTIAKINEA